MYCGFIEDTFILTRSTTVKRMIKYAIFVSVDAVSPSEFSGHVLIQSIYFVASTLLATFARGVFSGG